MFASWSPSFTQEASLLLETCAPCGLCCIPTRKLPWHHETQAEIQPYLWRPDPNTVLGKAHNMTTFQNTFKYCFLLFIGRFPNSAYTPPATLKNISDVHVTQPGKLDSLSPLSLLTGNEENLQF